MFTEFYLGRLKGRKYVEDLHKETGGNIKMAF
jgi:hypothetical protein